jgi:hypothetical protein
MSIILFKAAIQAEAMVVFIIQAGAMGEPEEIFEIWKTFADLKRFRYGGFVISHRAKGIIMTFALSVRKTTEKLILTIVIETTET